MAHGLGGRNLIKELRVIELLSDLVTICKERLPVQQEWLLDAAERIAQQQVTQGGFNFRHGSVYLTPSSFTAVNYATRNRHGSEALQHFMLLWKRLQENNIRLPTNLTDCAQPIIDFTARPKTPILIRVDCVPADVLASERGGPAIHIIERIESVMKESFFSVMCQQTNFELLKAISIGKADVFRIVDQSRNPEEAVSFPLYESD